MYIPHFVHTMSVRVYDMFGNFGFGIYMSTHIVKFTYMSVTCLADSIVNDMYIPCMYTFLPCGQDSGPDEQVQVTVVHSESSYMPPLHAIEDANAAEAQRPGTAADP